MDTKIDTSAEAAENAALPRLHEVHVDPDHPCAHLQELPEALKSPSESKSPARWAYERLIMYIRNFEEQLENTQEAAIGFTGSDAGVLRIEGMGYFDPDIITFFGTDPAGARTQLIQHVSQLNVILRAMPQLEPDKAPKRIGFRLAAELDKDSAATGDSDAGA